jgi:hypothetical protein
MSLLTGSANPSGEAEVRVAFKDNDEWSEAVTAAQGALLGRAAGIDFSLGQMLATYFEIPDDKRMRFAATIGMKLGYRAKLDTLRAILREAGLAEENGALLADLEKIGQGRNRVAHSGAWVGPRGLTDEQATFIGTSKGQLMLYDTTVESLRDMERHAHRALEYLEVAHAKLGALPRSAPPTKWNTAPLRDEEGDDQTTAPE